MTWCRSFAGNRSLKSALFVLASDLGQLNQIVEWIAHEKARPVDDWRGLFDFNSVLPQLDAVRFDIVNLQAKMLSVRVFAWRIIDENVDLVPIRTSPEPDEIRPIKGRWRRHFFHPKCFAVKRASRVLTALGHWNTCVLETLHDGHEPLL
jgi:hypothetical protein